MDRVVATQCVLLGKRSRSVRKRGVESDHVQFPAQLIDASHCAPQRAHVDSSSAMGRRRGGARFGVDQLAGGDGLRSIPQLGGDVRSWLVEDELDQC